MQRRSLLWRNTVHQANDRTGQNSWPLFGKLTLHEAMIAGRRQRFNLSRSASRLILTRPLQIKPLPHKSGFFRSSRAGEFHPHPLTEPDVRLSTHPALPIQPRAGPRVATGQIALGPVEQCALTSASTPALVVSAFYTSLAPMLLGPY